MATCVVKKTMLSWLRGKAGMTVEDDKKIDRTCDDQIRHLYYLPQGIARLEELGEVIRVGRDYELNRVDEVATS